MSTQRQQTHVSAVTINSNPTHNEIYQNSEKTRSGFLNVVVHVARLVTWSERWKCFRFRFMRTFGNTELHKNNPLPMEIKFTDTSELKQ